MAYQVLVGGNKVKKPQKPQILVTGSIVNKTIARRVRTYKTYSFDHNSTIDAGNNVHSNIRTFNADETPTFYVGNAVNEWVEISFSLAEYPLYTTDYHQRENKLNSTTFQGMTYNQKRGRSSKRAAKNPVLGDRACIYYTLNGKSPRKTKNNLYTGTIRLRRNITGDTTTIKAVAYYHGQKSDVNVATIRIARLVP